MTVSRRSNWRTFRYDFVVRTIRYTGNTHQTTRAAALASEREIRRRAIYDADHRRPLVVDRTPFFDEWAPIYLDHVFRRFQRGEIRRPDFPMWIVGALLRFFGSAPSEIVPTPEAPYHNLRLGDVIADPAWVGRFEDWLTDRRLGAQSKAHYRGMARRLFQLALTPRYQRKTGVTANPFVTAGR